MIRQDLRAWKEKKECARRMREILRGPQEPALHTLDSPGGKALPKPNNLFPASSAPPEGVYSSLVKQKIKAKIYAVFCFAGKKKLLFYIYAVIVKQNFYKRSTNHY